MQQLTPSRHTSSSSSSWSCCWSGKFPRFGQILCCTTWRCWWWWWRCCWWRRWWWWWWWWW